MHRYSFVLLIVCSFPAFALSGCAFGDFAAPTGEDANVVDDSSIPTDDVPSGGGGPDAADIAVDAQTSLDVLPDSTELDVASDAGAVNFDAPDAATPDSTDVGAALLGVTTPDIRTVMNAHATVPVVGGRFDCRGVGGDVAARLSIGVTADGNTRWVGYLDNDCALGARETAEFALLQAVGAESWSAERVGHALTGLESLSLHAIQYEFESADTFVDGLARIDDVALDAAVRSVAVLLEDESKPVHHGLDLWSSRVEEGDRSVRVHTEMTESAPREFVSIGVAVNGGSFEPLWWLHHPNMETAAARMMALFTPTWFQIVPDGVETATAHHAQALEFHRFDGHTTEFTILAVRPAFFGRERGGLQAQLIAGGAMRATLVSAAWTAVGWLLPETVSELFAAIGGEGFDDIPGMIELCQESIGVDEECCDALLEAITSMVSDFVDGVVAEDGAPEVASSMLTGVLHRALWTDDDGDLEMGILPACMAPSAAGGFFSRLQRVMQGVWDRFNQIRDAVDFARAAVESVSTLTAVAAGPAESVLEIDLCEACDSGRCSIATGAMVCAPAVTAPSPPVLVSPAAGSVSAPGTIRFEWRADPTIEVYTIDVCRDLSMTGGCLGPWVQGGLFAPQRDATVSGYGTWYWAVTGANIAGEATSPPRRLEIAPPIDRVAPTVAITSPASGHTVRTASVSVRGSAADERGVTVVRWSTSRGESGTCSGTANWTCSVALRTGVQSVTVIARDAAGNEGSATVAVSRTECVCDEADPCCVDGCEPAPTTRSCDTETEYVCSEGSVCGADVFRRTRTRHCDGVSGACAGAWTAWSAPELEDVCSAAEVCDPGDATCDPVSATASLGCWDGDVYWYDACGARRDRADRCEADEHCEESGDDARCVTDEPTSGPFEPQQVVRFLNECNGQHWTMRGACPSDPMTGCPCGPTPAATASNCFAVETCWLSEFSGGAAYTVADVEPTWGEWTPWYHCYTSETGNRYQTTPCASPGSPHLLGYLASTARGTWTVPIYSCRWSGTGVPEEFTTHRPSECDAVGGTLVGGVLGYASTSRR